MSHNRFLTVLKHVSAGEEFEADVCETALAAPSEMNVRFLRAPAQGDVGSSTTEIADRLGVATDYGQKYRKRLIDAGVIEPCGWGRVRTCVPLLKGYLGERGR